MSHRRLLCALSCLLLLGVEGCSKRPKDPRRHYEEQGGFSYIPPEGWKVMEFPGLKYKISCGQRANEFAPNINVVDEAFGGALDDYVDASVTNMEKLFKNLRIVSREPFSPEGGLSSVKLITENEQFGRPLRQTFFFFDKGNKMYVVTCSALGEGGEELDDLFDAAMKTFLPH